MNQVAKITPTFADRPLPPEGSWERVIADAQAQAGIEVVHHGRPIGHAIIQPLSTAPHIPHGKAIEAPPEVPDAAPEVAPLKVALVGTAPSSRMLAPYGDHSWKIWACSPGNMGILPRVDVWFELHGNLMWPEHAAYGPQYLEWLRRQPFPIFMQSQEYVPNATVFPKDELVAEFGRDFFTSSFAWMMAKAIHDGAKEIALYGIDMASKDEYHRQRAGFFFFKRMAEERGIKVSAPNESDIMMHPGLYGYSEVTPFGRKVLARQKELQERVNQLTQQKGQIENNLAYLQGALEDIQYFELIWSGVEQKG